MNEPLSELLSDNSQDRLIEFVHDGYPVHVKFLRSAVKTNRLVIAFHGAIVKDPDRPVLNRTRNSRAISGYAHQISIFDPARIRNDEISIGWYLGDHCYPAQEILRSFIDRVIDTLQVERIVYFGSSGGGFASLYFGFHNPNSIVLPIVPQTKILSHHKAGGRGSFSRYCSNCWPGLRESDVAQKVCVDVASLYASRPFRNAVVYVMSPGDTRHYAHHATPFLSEVYGSLDIGDINLSLVSDYWGVPGHGGAIPAAGFMPWLRAALTAPSIAQQDILDTYHSIRLQTQPPAPEKTRPASSGQSQDYAARDLDMAQTLQRYQLGATAKGR